jgi:endonuclease/exonuclease/phosphatase family metal-dependent hydrolase
VCKAPQTLLRLCTAAACFLALCGCAARPIYAVGLCNEHLAPNIGLSSDGKTASLRLDVLTYNIEGVPGRSGRRGELKQIGARLATMRKAGEAPDVVLFQEMFSRDAAAAVRKTGYPNIVSGPTRGQRRTLPKWGERRGHKWRRGEWGVRLVGSGLAIASAYPIQAHASEPFSGRACAGFDCLANKGSMLASLSIPGVPGELDVFNTHMNAQGASRVPMRRHLPVHRAQARELSDFVARSRAPGAPVILGGDFNMRRSEARFDAFEANETLQLVHQYCLRDPGDCHVETSWDGDAPWMDTQDLQFFQSGAGVQVRPVRVQTLFDGRPGSPVLSDHDGFLVTYELSWRRGFDAPASVQRAASGHHDIARNCSIRR